MNIRKAITIFDEDSNSISTLVKPFKEKSIDMIFLIEEDSHGDAICTLMKIDEIREKFNLNNININEILRIL